MGIYSCVLNCPSFDFQCIPACIQVGGTAGQAAFVSLFACVVEDCGFNISGTCIQQSVQSACASQFETCQQSGG